MSAKTSMTDEMKTVADEISSWAQILITKLHSIKSYTEKNMQNIKAYIDLLYIFVMNWNNFMLTTSAVATLSSSQESVNCMNSLTLKQLIAAMSVNQHSKWCFFDSFRFREKRVKFRS